jgi:deoxyribonuclease (pyrimidine dimer)
MKRKMNAMVRINLVEPRRLADQHLVAEYNEILMLLGYVRKYPALGRISEKYTLGKGHMMFFKDKLLYLKKRHELLKEEMRRREFSTNITISLSDFDKILFNDWMPTGRDYSIIKARIIEKLLKKPGYYRYYGKEKGPDFFIKLLA